MSKRFVATGRAITRREALGLIPAGLLSLSCTSSVARSGPPRSPNVVLIFGDFMGYNDTGPYGAPDVRTPNLDRLAREGIRFTDAYSTAPVCTPSRAGFLTGRYQHRFGGEQNIGETGRWGLPQSEMTVARMLKNAGYRTSMAGKWHLGFTPESSPHAHGFDEALYFNGWAIDYHSHRSPNTGSPAFLENGTPVEIAGYSTDIFTDRATSFIDRSARSPFLVYVAYNAALPPAQPPDRSTDIRVPGPDSVRYTEFTRYTRQDYVATVEAFDKGIGRILDAIDRSSLVQDTIVVFTYDHGGEPPARHTPLSGGFRTLWEGGIRVPLIIRWPGTLPAGQVSNAQVSLLDLMPTIATASNTRAAPARPFDGIDLVTALRTPTHERSLFWRLRPPGDRPGWVSAVRRGRWKYIDASRPLAAFPDRDVMGRDGYRDPDGLFDVAADPSERTNLASRYPDVVRQLKQAISDWEADVYRPGRGGARNGARQVRQ